ncbi:hypothetical protein MALV_44270 [Mycolicibacterium alvei]|uniref:Uncharacterized protein n=1 Tax=Mycolicibacterium alvei TaxID=67081 RepID=A0A6N4V0S3_9MYCO|nr:hypothetical protein MALV_44270 [Mycolicibacterium alvei]
MGIPVLTHPHVAVDAGFDDRLEFMQELQVGVFLRHVLHPPRVPWTLSYLYLLVAVNISVYLGDIKFRRMCHTSPAPLAVRR